MASISIADIKALRERTGAGMTDVKKALEEAGGDSEMAIELIRKRGLAKAAKREGHSATEGLIAAAVVPTSDGQQAGTILELNAETDFVVKNEKFLKLAEKVLAAVVASAVGDAQSALDADANGQSVGDLITETSGTLGEKIVLRRVARLEGPNVTAYLHKTARDLPPSLGVLVVTDAKAADVADDVAHQIAAMNPGYLTRADVPAVVVEKEREIARELSIAEGKPEAALDKIVEGRLNGFFKENVLDEQVLAKDGKITVGKYVAGSGGAIKDFVRFRVGA